MKIPSNRSNPTLPSTERTLGMHLRAVRKQHGWRLTELARNIGCSVGYLSQIERGVSSPSLRAMIALAQTFGINLSALFPAESEPLGEKSRFVLRHNQRSRLDLSASGIVKESLTDRHGGGALNLYEMVIAPGCGSGEEPLVHSGEECGVLLTGRMSLEIDGSLWELEPGDSFHFPSTLPHRYRNLADEEARIIWVTTTPKSALPQP